MAELAEIRDVRTPDGKKLTRKRALAEKIWAKGIQDGDLEAIRMIRDGVFVEICHVPLVVAHPLSGVHLILHKTVGVISPEKLGSHGPPCAKETGREGHSNAGSGKGWGLARGCNVVTGSREIAPNRKGKRE